MEITATWPPAENSRSRSEAGPARALKKFLPALLAVLAKIFLTADAVIHGLSMSLAPGCMPRA
jgi:hypothetical protein